MDALTCGAIHDPASWQVSQRFSKSLRAADQERFNHRDPLRVQRLSESIRLCGRQGVPFALLHDAIVESDHGLVSQADTLARFAAFR